MTACLVALGLALASALAAAVLSRSPRLALRVGTVGTLAAAAAAFTGGLSAVLGAGDEALELPWPLPFGAVRVGLDPLSGFFLVCGMAVAAIAALHALRSRDPARAPRAAPYAALYALTVAAIVAVALARDGVLFLVAWEGMTIASWRLVGLEEESGAARRAAMTYLIASHVGAAALYVMFALLAGHAGGYGFAEIAAPASPLAPALAGTAFALAVAGFGAKAAFFPLHVWAPDAYPEAPPPAAALLSGALSKMGIYGIARMLLLLAPAGGPPPAAWWGTLLIVIGAATAVTGALNALARRDLKRLVAFSSVENLGIVALGLGLGLLGRAHGIELLAFLGFAGALLHVLNHGVMKSLLLLLAGDVSDAAGTRTLDRMGGLARRMPVTAATFLIGAVAISGLPPGNGFLSEWLIFTAGLRGAGSLPPVAAAASALAAELPSRVAALLSGAPPAAAAQARAGLAGVAWTAVVLLACTAGLAWLRAFLLRRREIRSGPVWGCAYEAIGPRLQYTATGFPEPVTGPLGSAVPRSRVDRQDPEGYFPPAAHYNDRMADPAGERVVVPLVRRFVAALGRVKVLQTGRLQLYLLYVLATLVILLSWELVISP